MFASDGVGALFGDSAATSSMPASTSIHLPFADLKQARATPSLRDEITCWARHHDHPIFGKRRCRAAGSPTSPCPALRGRSGPTAPASTRYYDALDPAWYDSRGSRRFSTTFRQRAQERTYQDIFRETARAVCGPRTGNVRHSARAFRSVLRPPLVEFMFRVPGDLKIRDGVTKRLLRDAMPASCPRKHALAIKKTGGMRRRTFGSRGVGSSGSAIYRLAGVS